MRPDPVARRGEEAHLRALEALYASAPVNQLFESRLALPEAGRSEIRFTVAARQLSCRRRGAWHALFQDARRCGFLCRQWPGQRPLPADHRLQPSLHQADADWRGARRRTLDLGQAAGIRRRGADHRLPKAKNAHAAPAPSCARTSPCPASTAIAPADGRASAGPSRGGRAGSPGRGRGRLRRPSSSAAIPIAAL